MLEEHAELARISKKLVTLHREVPVELPLDALARTPIEPAKLFPFLKAMEFFTITKRLAGLLEVDPEAWPADPELAAKPAEPVGFDNAARAEARAARQAAAGLDTSPAVLHAQLLHEQMKALPLDHSAYEIIRDAEHLTRWIEEIRLTGIVATDTETTGLDNQVADLVGISFSTAPGNGAYLPLGHTEGNGDIFGGGHAEGQMDLREALELLKPDLRRPLDPEDLPQRQIRPRRARPLRHRGQFDRRQPAAQLLARRPAVQHHGRALASTGSATRASRSRSCSAPARRRRPSPRCRSPTPRNTPPRTPTSPSGSGSC